MTTSPIHWFVDSELPATVVSVAAAEASARKQLAAAQQLDIRDLEDMQAAHGLLTTALGDLLNALTAERGTGKAVA